MLLRLATPSDLPAVCALYMAACERMQAADIHQWQWGEYPNEDMLRQDIDLGQLYVLDGRNELASAVCVNRIQDKEYDDVPWLFGNRPGSFHRLAIHPVHQGRGLFRYVLEGVESIHRAQG